MEKRAILNCSFFYHHADQLGGGNIDLDSNGAILQVVDYYPFGEVRNQYNSSEYENKYKFGGKERDTESGLDYFEVRYYDNGIGRFNSIDRVFWEAGESERHYQGLYDPQKLNAYSYVSNNPLTRTDDSGEWWDIAVDTVVASLGYGVGKVTGDEYLVIGAKNMLKDTLNPKNALNPVKKIKKVQKLGDAGKKIKISRQKQNKHIEGTKEHTQAIQNGDTKSVWKNPAEADKLTKEAYEKGTPYKGQQNKLIYDVGKQVGKDPKETKVQVHKSKTGVHGNPHK